MNRYRSLNSQRGYKHFVANNHRSLNSSFYNSDIADRVAYKLYEYGYDTDTFEVFECEFKDDCLIATVYIGDHIGNEDQFIAYDVNENSSEADIEAAVKHVANLIGGHCNYYIIANIEAAWNAEIYQRSMRNPKVRGISDYVFSVDDAPYISTVDNDRYAGIYCCEVSVKDIDGSGKSEIIDFKLNKASISMAIKSFANRLSRQ